jgi:hypothetical protein
MNKRGGNMTDKLTQQWMLEHPNDAACPRTPAAAKAWRIKRGLELSDADKAIRAKYEAAMAERKAR